MRYDTHQIPKLQKVWLKELPQIRVKSPVLRVPEPFQMIQNGSCLLLEINDIYDFQLQQSVKVNSFSDTDETY